MMTRQEFVDWQAFYLLEPFDDLNRYHRPAALLGELVSDLGPYKVEAQGLIDWLRHKVKPPEPAPSGHQYSEAELNSLRAHGFDPTKRAKAKG